MGSLEAPSLVRTIQEAGCWGSLGRWLGPLQFILFLQIKTQEIIKEKKTPFGSCSLPGEGEAQPASVERAGVRCKGCVFKSHVEMRKQSPGGKGLFQGTLHQCWALLCQNQDDRARAGLPHWHPLFPPQVARSGVGEIPHGEPWRVGTGPWWSKGVLQCNAGGYPFIWF